MDYSKLKKEIPYKWKVQSYNYNKTKGSCVAYIDARDVMDILDEVVGPDKWQDKYEFVGTKLIAGIGIKGVNKDDEWVWKYDTGVESQSEADKGQFSDAFKRAAVKWGIGRFLYNLEIKWVNIIDQKYPADENGKRIYDLTEYLESRKTNVYPEPSVVSQPNAPRTSVGVCPKCDSPLITKMTKKGEVIVCSTSGWDSVNRMATGCSFIQWPKAEDKLPGDEYYDKEDVKEELPF